MTYQRPIAPGALRDQLGSAYLSYYETEFALRDASLRSKRAELLTATGGLGQEPFLELLPTYVPSELDVGGVCAGAGLPEMASLLSAGLLSGIQHPYAHQVEALEAFNAGKSVVMTSGTGSGKTESFLLPIMAGLVRESRSWSARPTGPQSRWYAGLASPFQPQRDDHDSRPAAIRALILYPMNALVDDQLVRLRRALGSPSAESWLDTNRPGQRFWFGRYTSQTPVSGPRPAAGKNSGKTKDLRNHLQLLERRHERLRSLVQEGKVREEDAYFLANTLGSEMRSRWDMQLSPPDVLITNYSMLNVAMMRDDETSMFEQTRRWIEANASNVFTLVVDEMHLYRGTAGSEVAYLVRRLRSRLGLDDKPDQFRVIATTASIDWSRTKDRDFVTGFFDKPASAFSAVTGERVESSEADLPLDVVERLRRGGAGLDPATVRAAVEAPFRQSGWRPVGASKVATSLFPREPEPARVLDELIAWAGETKPAAFRLRAHLMFRNLIGFWACSSSACPDSEGAIGRLYSQPFFVCGAVGPDDSTCGGRVLELLYCEHCGEAFLGGHTATGTNDPNTYLVSTSANLEGLPDAAEQRRTAATYRLLWPRADREPLDMEWTRGKAAYTYEWIPVAYDPQAGRATGRGTPTAWLLNVKEKGAGHGENVPALPDNCPACGHQSRRDRDMDFEDAGWVNTVVRTMGTGYERVTQVLVGALHRTLETPSVIFSDSRQDAARVNAGIELAHYLDTVRQVVVSSMQHQDALDRVINQLNGVDESSESAALVAMLKPGTDARKAANRLAAEVGLEGDEALVRDALPGGSEISLRTVASRAMPPLVLLGINPAGIAVSAQSTKSGQRWTDIWDWSGDEPAQLPDHALNPGLRELRFMIEEALSRQVRSVVFAGQGRDLESLGIARASAGTVPEGAGGLTPGVFEQVRDSCVRMLGHLQRFQDGDMRAGDGWPANVVRFTKQVAVDHHADPDQVLSAIGEALN